VDNLNYKIQVLNGFKMYFDQITSVFKNLYDSNDKVNLDTLSTLTGLNRRKTRLILNYLADIGLSEKRTLKKTSLGKVIYQYDEFFQNEGTLWLIHYLQSTNHYLIIWNRTLNMLYDHDQINRSYVLEKFADLKDHCSEYTFKHHIGKEIRIILDAFTNQQFNHLNILELQDNRYVINRNLDVPPLILFATILLYKENNYPGATAIDINELCKAKDSPGRIFIIDEGIFRRKLEDLKKMGLINIESRADLDQIRIVGDYNLEGVLKSYYMN
jgi:hypothetical protein